MEYRKSRGEGEGRIFDGKGIKARISFKNSNLFNILIADLEKVMEKGGCGVE